jgi:hypothetical protein
VAFGETGRDDNGLPPVNVVVPDDARELERDILAYHRELRAQRRRRLLGRVLRPLTGPVTIVPLIAVCAALSMVAAAVFSVLTVSPASAPTRLPRPPAIIAPLNPHHSSAPATKPTPATGHATHSPAPRSTHSAPVGSAAH